MPKKSHGEAGLVMGDRQEGVAFASGDTRRNPSKVHQFTVVLSCASLNVAVGWCPQLRGRNSCLVGGVSRKLNNFQNIALTWKRAKHSSNKNL